MRSISPMQLRNERRERGGAVMTIIQPKQEAEEMTNQQRQNLMKNLGVTYVNGKIIKIPVFEKEVKK